MGDGRSIWLFQAKRLFTHGFVPLTELRHPDSLWSHPDYPLLFPASLAQLAALHGAFDERLAATAIPLLLGACLGALWLLAREALGRTAGAAFTLGLALSLDRLATGGYADGFLALLLLVQFLAVVSGGRDAIAWIAAACASLVKGEGILLALPVAVLFTVARIRKEGRISWRGLAPWLCLLPGPAYTLWIRAQGVDTVLKDKAAGAIASELPARLARAFAEAPLPFLVQGYTELRDLLWSGALALAVSMALLALRRGGRRQGRLALVVAATWTGMAFVAVSVPPEDVGWFVRTALDRLLAAPAALLVLAPLLLLAGDPVPSRAEGLPGER